MPASSATLPSATSKHFSLLAWIISTTPFVASSRRIFDILPKTGRTGLLYNCVFSRAGIPDACPSSDKPRPQIRRFHIPDVERIQRRSNGVFVTCKLKLAVASSGATREIIKSVDCPAAMTKTLESFALRLWLLQSFSSYSKALAFT